MAALSSSSITPMQLGEISFADDGSRSAVEGLKRTAKTKLSSAALKFSIMPMQLGEIYFVEVGGGKGKLTAVVLDYLNCQHPWTDSRR